MFYRFFQSKEEVMHALGNQMFFEDNPFEAVKGRKDLNGLQKIRSLLSLNQSNAERNQINMQAISILKDPHILAAAVGENRRVLTPLWLELLEEELLHKYRFVTEALACMGLPLYDDDTISFIEKFITDITETCMC